METVLLVIHLLIAIALVAVVLVQRSEGGALGIGGSSSGGGMLSARGKANLLTRSTAILAALFFISSLGLAIYAHENRAPTSIMEIAPAQTPAVEESSTPQVPDAQ